METVVLIQFGSHMYGTNVATSDLDYKSIFIPRAEDILLQRARHNISTTTKVVKDSKNSAHDVDTESFALHEWMKLLLDGNTIETTLMIYGKMLEEYGTRAFQAERNEGIDGKALMHAVRVCEEAKELLRDHRITFPRPERKLLLTIRQGEMDYKEVAEIIEAGFADLEALEKTTTLPPKPDRKAMDDFIAKHYRQAVLAA